MHPTELKKNEVHIKRVKGIIESISNTRALTAGKEVDFKRIKNEIAGIRKGAEGAFNNREMALVNTKLQEASHWADEHVKSMVVRRLTEACNWAREYIEILS